ncbi:MAG: hypothetical protein QM765_23420 [Myxococcales bacterium]
MAKREASGSEQGAALLKAVERIVDSPAKIRAHVEAAAEKIRVSLPDDATEVQVRSALERDLVSHYSNRTAIAGGAAALPGLIPGLGSLAAVLGGGLLDMTACLKFEVEMVLALAASRGYDIEDPRERQLAYLLAAAHTYEASGGLNPLPDLIKTEIDAIWHYTPRQLGKLVAALFVKLAILFAGKSLTRAIPFIGIVVSSATNKTLTSRVGKSVIKALDGRASARAAASPKPAAKPKAHAKAKKAPARKKKPAA